MGGGVCAARGCGPRIVRLMIQVKRPYRFVAETADVAVKPYAAWRVKVEARCMPGEREGDGEVH